MAIEDSDKEDTKEEYEEEEVDYREELLCAIEVIRSVGYYFPSRVV
jgi:hypothetical protein